ncbi:MAG: zinc ribbon domain-containing protein [Candidatus Helarchaeota archaeon]
MANNEQKVCNKCGSNMTPLENVKLHNLVFSLLICEKCKYTDFYFKGKSHTSNIDDAFEQVVRSVNMF